MVIFRELLPCQSQSLPVSNGKKAVEGLVEGKADQVCRAVDPLLSRRE